MSERPSILTLRDSIAPFLSSTIDTETAASRPLNGTKRGSPARGPDLRSLSAELADLQQEHEQLQQRYEVLRRQYRRLQGVREPSSSPRVSTVMSLAGELEGRASLSLSTPLLTLPPVTDRGSFGGGGLLVRPSLQAFKEQDGGPMMYLGDEEGEGGVRGVDEEERDSFVSRRSSTVEQTSFVRGEKMRSQVDLRPTGVRGGVGDGRDSLATVMVGGPTIGSPSPYRKGHEAPYRVLRQGFLLKRSDYRRQWNYRYCRLCSDGVIRYTGSDGKIFLDMA